MRILFATYAEKTHFLGMVPMAWALQTAGHEVRVASQPELTPVVTAAGLTAVPVGRDHTLHRVMRQIDGRAGRPGTGGLGTGGFDFAESRPEKLTWPYVAGGYHDVVPWWFRLVNDPMTDDLVAFCRQWEPDLVIWEPVTYSGAIAAVATGAAHARLMWCVDLFTRMRRHFLRLRGEQPDGLADWLDARARRHGVRFDETMTTGQFTIDTVPDSLRRDPAFGVDLDLDYLPMRYVPYNGVSVIEPWLRKPPERRRVCLTLGVYAAEHMAGYAVSPRDLLDALADVDAEIVATLPAAQQAALGPLPANTRAVAFAPLNALVPTCAAVIHHGSNGTYCTTAVHGVPQVIVPFFFQGKPLARYAAGRGAALTLPVDAVTGDAVRTAVCRLLDEPSFKAGAAGLQAEMNALPSPNDLVGAIEQRVVKYRHHR